MKDYKIEINEIGKYGGLTPIRMDIVLESQLGELVCNFLSADFKKREEILSNSK